MQNADKSLLCDSELMHFFFQTQNHLLTVYTQFLHFMLFLLSKIVYYGVKKQKGQHVFRKNEIIYVRHIVFSVAQKKENLWTSVI